MVAATALDMNRAAVPGPARSADDILSELCQKRDGILSSLESLSFSHLETMEDSLAGWMAQHTYAPKLKICVEQTTRILQDLRARFGRPTPSIVSGDFELDLNAAGSDRSWAVKGEEVDAAVGRVTADRVRESSDDRTSRLIMSIHVLGSKLNQQWRCFAAAMEANDRWRIIEEGEECTRRIRSTVLGIVDMTAQCLKPGAGRSTPTAAQELQMALTVRKALLAFRKNVVGMLTGIEDSADSCVLDCSRQAAEALRAFAQTDPFELLRPHDRFELRRLQERLEPHTKGPTNCERARQVLLDLRATAELFIHINQRACLVEHDKNALLRCREEIADAAELSTVSPAEGWRRVDPVLSCLLALEWRSSSIPTLVSMATVYHAPTAQQVRDWLRAARHALDSIHL